MSATKLTVHAQACLRDAKTGAKFTLDALLGKKPILRKRALDKIQEISVIPADGMSKDTQDKFELIQDEDGDMTLIGQGLLDAEIDALLGAIRAYSTSAPEVELTVDRKVYQVLFDPIETTMERTAEPVVKKAAEPVVKKTAEPVVMKTVIKKSPTKAQQKRAERPSPSEPAKEFAGQQRIGNSGNVYVSKANVNGIYSWRPVKVNAEEMEALAAAVAAM